MARMKKPIRFIILMVIIFSVSILGVIKVIDMAKGYFGYGKITFNKISTMDYDEKKDIFIVPFGDGFAAYGANTLKLVTFEGNEKWQVSESIENPLMRASQELLFLADKDKGRITAIDDQGKTLWFYDIKRTIRNFVVNGNGQIALFAENEGGGGEILILDSQGKETGNISLSKGILMNIAISEEDPMVALSLFNIENDTIEAQVVLYSITGKLLGGNNYKGDMISNLFFDKTNQLVIVGDQRIMGFSKENRHLWTKELKNPMDKIAWNKQGFIVINAMGKKSIIDTKNQSALSVIDTKGLDIGKVPLNGDVLGLDTYGNNILVFTDRTLYFVSKDGKELGEKKINNDIQGVHMISDDKILLVLKNRIETIQVKFNGE